MRRLLVLLVVVGLVGLSPENAGAADATRFRTTGFFTVAGWTDFPGEGRYESGVVYTNTFVFASDRVDNFVSTEDKYHSRTRSLSLSIYQFEFMYDGQGAFTPLRAINASAYSPWERVTLTVQTDLSAAHAEGTVGRTICTPPPDWKDLGPNTFVICGSSWNPQSGGTADVSISWEGQGQIIKDDGRDHYASPCWLEQHHSQDSFRNAIASVSFDNNDLGTQLVAQISHVQSLDVLVDHFPPTPKVMELCFPPS